MAIESCYHSPTSRVKHGNSFSSPFPTCHGVKYVGLCTLTFSLSNVMNPLLQRMRHLKCTYWRSIHGIPLQVLLFMLMMFTLLLQVYIHSVVSQFSDIDEFTSDVGLRLNTSKLKLIQVSQTPIEHSSTGGRSSTRNKKIS